jgi:hypothetical protein
MAHLEAVRVPHLHFQLSSPMSFTTLCNEKSDLLMDVFISTGNNIREKGATSLSESLKSSTTLTLLSLEGEY